jgi:hypothetical protein
MALAGLISCPSAEETIIIPPKYKISDKKVFRLPIFIGICSTGSSATMIAGSLMACECWPQGMRIRFQNAFFILYEEGDLA